MTDFSATKTYYVAQGAKFSYLIITCNGKESEKKKKLTESFCCTPETLYVNFNF